MGENVLKLRGTKITLDELESPTFIGLRQKDFKAAISCNVSILDGEAGITLYMDENHHYDLALRKCTGGYEVIKRLNIGDIKSVEEQLEIKNINNVSLIIQADHEAYSFFIQLEKEKINLGTAQTKYLSSEIAGGFTGVIIGLYASNQGNYTYACFKDFKCNYFSF